MSIRWPFLLLMVLLFVGCRDTNSPKTVKEYAGLYQYVSPPEFEHLSLPWLRLTEDGVYTGFDNTPAGEQERVLKRGRWRIVNGVNPQIALDQDYYPIGQSGSRFRITLNDDRGQYYERVK